LIAGFLCGVIVFLILFFAIPESIRFLLVKRKDKKAMEIVRNLA
jgi:hypothetical protein